MAQENPPNTQNSDLTIPRALIDEFDITLGRLFDLAVKTCIYYDEDCQEHAWQGFMNIRDAFVHFQKVYWALKNPNPSTLPKDMSIEHNKSEMFSHLRRALIETLESHLDHKLEILIELQKNISKFQRYNIPIPNERYISSKLYRINDYKEAGRYKKTEEWQESATNYLRGITLVKQLISKFPQASIVLKPPNQVRKIIIHTLEDKKKKARNKFIEYLFGIIGVIGSICTIATLIITLN